MTEAGDSNTQNGDGTASEDPFHAGERAIQTQTGERSRALALAGNMARAVPERAQRFLAQQAFCLIGARDRTGDLWAVFLAGAPGFAGCNPEGRRLSLDLVDPGHVLSAIPPLADLAAGQHLGALFVDLATRRRLRINGEVEALTSGRLTVSVARAYPLCPKYIQRRPPLASASPTIRAIERGTELTSSLRDWIAAADTFFVASAHPEGPADVSHRGGRPGFVTIEGTTLLIPDYPGNGMFNTLGNFALNPRAGLVFVDFEANRQLQMTGAVELDLTADAATDATGGTGRWWRFRPGHWVIAPLNQGFRWAAPESSPYNP